MARRLTFDELFGWAQDFGTLLTNERVLTVQEIRGLRPHATDDDYEAFKHNLRQEDWCTAIGFRYDVIQVGGTHYVIIETEDEAEAAMARGIHNALNDLRGEYNTIVAPDPKGAGSARKAHKLLVATCEAMLSALQEDDE